MTTEILLPPLTHRLETSAGRLTRIWFVFATLAFALAGILRGLASSGLIDKGDRPMPLLVLGVTCLIIAGFCAMMGFRARREFRRMRQGDYLARWTYPPADADLARSPGNAEGRYKVKALFHIPFWAIFGVGAILGIIGAFAKSDPWLALRIGGASLGLGLAAGAFFAIPTHFLTGIADRIARSLEPEVVFTRTGIYVPGRFYPVMDFAPGSRAFSVKQGTGNRKWLVGHLQQRVHHPGAHPGQTVSVVISQLIPEGREEEAGQLADYFSR